MDFLKNADKRGKTYAYTLIGCIVAMAAIGLLGIWGVGPAESLFYKLVLTFITIGSLSAFLYTLNIGNDKKYSQKLVYIIGGSVMSLAILVLLQLWTSFVADALFGKIISTFIIVSVLSAFILAVTDDFFEDKKLKDENYLD